MSVPVRAAARTTLSPAAALLMKTIMALPSGGLGTHRLRRSLLLLRELLIAKGDPPYMYSWRGIPLLLPLSHDLPLHTQAAPHYGTNLARLASHVATKYEHATAVDVGANVGDTTALLHRAGIWSTLAIEGNAKFIPFLVANTTVYPEVEIEPSYVAADLPAHAVVMSAGTASLVPAPNNAAPVPALGEPLQELLNRHPLFANFRLIKTDTDGWDAAILISSVDVLHRAKAIVFFEYDPNLTRWIDPRLPTPREALSALRDAGYAGFIFWRNTGTYLFAAGSSPRELDHADAVISARPGFDYADVAAFHPDDLDLFWSIRNEEEARYSAVTHDAD